MKGKIVPKRKAIPRGAPDQRPVALTVKVDSKTFVRLSTLRATTRRTHQEILTEALNEYLDRIGAK